MDTDTKEKPFNVRATAPFTSVTRDAQTNIHYAFLCMCASASKTELLGTKHTELLASQLVSNKQSLLQNIMTALKCGNVFGNCTKYGKNYHAQFCLHRIEQILKWIKKGFWKNCSRLNRQFKQTKPLVPVYA